MAWLHVDPSEARQQVVVAPAGVAVNAVGTGDAGEPPHPVHGPALRRRVGLVVEEIEVALPRGLDRLRHLGLGHAGMALLLEPALLVAVVEAELAEIGRASCRERVCQYV